MVCSMRLPPAKTVGATAILVNENDLICVDQIPICKVLTIEGKIYLEFRDKNSFRSQYRRTELVRVDLETFLGTVGKIGKE